MSSLDTIDQPALILDEKVVRKNISRMAKKASQKGVRFRPHFKTHQSAQIGEWFREAGVAKITVSSVEMAEYFAEHGWSDILIAFSLNPRQIKRIHELADKIHLEVLVENEEAIKALSSSLTQKIDVWLKIDVGNHRTGLDWENLDAVEILCRKINMVPNLILRGLLTHSGHTYAAASKSEVCRIFREGVSRLTQLRQRLGDARISPLEISVGDTPGCSLCEDWSDINEVRPGNFVFYDASQFMGNACAFEDIGIALACPVVAKHVQRSGVVVYGGAIHLSKDFLTVNNEKTYGLVCLQEGDRWGKVIPGAVVRSLSQEHGIIRVPEADFEKISIGDLVFIIPAHSCLTVQVIGKYVTFEGEEISTFNRK
jgi:D-serine deaminase-like pyridoxal phosphate-dependent protein